MKLSLVLIAAAGVSGIPLFEGLWDRLPISFLGDEERTVLINNIPKVIKESEKLELLSSKINFMDVTDHQHLITNDIEVPVYSYPKKPHFEKEVKALTKQVNLTNLYENLKEFSGFHSRYYKSEYGLKSAQWLYHKLNSIIEENANPALNITVEKFSHKWLQFSTIVHIEGSENPDDIVVIGCHQDSTNLLLPNLLAAPGADDDGSGVTTNLEALRILLLNDFKPKNSVEFHFYSAEEGGLLGSLDIFSSYRSQNKTVYGMLQQDMTGFTQKTLDSGAPEHVGVIMDHVSVAFTDFIKVIIDSYLSIPWIETNCDYACSDHASALKYGYPSSFIIESEFRYSNPHIHSTSDTLDKLSFEHIAEFTKLVLGYSYELGKHIF